MTYKLGNRSKQRLQGVHPDLVAVVELAISISTEDFTVLEGMRSKTRQRQLYNAGKSTTMNSRHLTGHAVDIAPFPTNGDFDDDGVLNIHDWDEYHPMAANMKKAAVRLGVELEWGGDWKGFPDGPHFQLSWRTHP